MQVQAFVVGNGVAKKVNAALEVNGTPNLLLQVSCAPSTVVGSFVRSTELNRLLA